MSYEALKHLAERRIERDRKSDSAKDYTPCPKCGKYAKRRSIVGGTCPRCKELLHRGVMIQHGMAARRML